LYGDRWSFWFSCHQWLFNYLYFPWAWKSALLKLFQKCVEHIKLDIYVFIAKLKIKIQTLHIYSLIWGIILFSKKGLTWFEAQRCCASRSEQLATIGDKIVNCRNIPPGVGTLWTGNVRKPSEWIEFQGKLNEIKRYTYKYFK
jgi:hypothetical protein